ncbi:MAG: putative portal protein [Prokaryotic dsDNA virus sp.]|nr:MAG: putative portal protein [Prokaryotic dsDNA virus sp.]|tara:strand:+ start:1822 stop:3804 length:1983 start_codon:yes stop_codon:yes gene_type:complete
MADNKKNPRNPQSNLYKRLTRLLSTPIVNRRTQLQRRYRRADMDKYNFNSAQGLDFKKTSYNPYDNMTANIMQQQNRYERYIDFDQMEYTPEIASALDIYADEMTTSTNLSPMLKIKCSNDEIKLVLDNLYNNILNIDANLFGWSRSLCKFGDFMLYLDIDETTGIKNVISLPIDEVERLEGEDKTNPNYIQYQWNSGGLTFENWQVAHFRVLGNDKYAPYGTSILEPARRIWRQLTLLEDAMMAYRIVRSPERRVFYIDVGNIAPQDVEQFMQRVTTQMKRNQLIDSSTGRVDLRYNPLSIDEDYFIPVRGGNSSRVESLPGGSYTGDIDDVKYLRDKLFSALKIPMSYLSRGDGQTEDKATLAQKDIRFARTIQRLQRSVVSELEKIGLVHLYTLGYRGDDLISYKLVLNNPSKISELQELEHWKQKFDIAGAATEGFFSKRWIAEHVLGMSDEEFLRNQREMFYDKKFTSMLEKAAEEVPASSPDTGAAGGLGGGGGLDLGGGDDAGGGLDLGGADDKGGGLDLGGDTAAGGDDKPADAGADDKPDTALLAAPGNRPENPKMDKYGDIKKKRGDGKGRRKVKRTKDSEAGRAARTNSTRAVTDPIKRMFQDPAGSIMRTVYEGETNDMYHKEEKQLFNVSHDLKILLESMEPNKDEV